jgi:CBS domain-containing protein
MLRKIADMMAGGEFAELAPSATVYEAACLMKARKCGSVLVTDEHKLRGIFTERDLVNRVVAAKLDPLTTPLAQVMTEKPDTVRPDTLALEALRMMEDGGYRHLPVVKRGRILGVVSRRDFYGEEKAEVEKERSLWERIG